MTEEQQLESRSPRPRLFQLDALRGFAAVTVIFHHFHAAFPHLRFGWLFLLLGSGSPAVVLFFVLSGYVLSLPTWNGTQGRYSIYAARRLCRIYLPFAAAAALSILAALFFQRFHPPLTPWYLQTWHSPVTLPQVLLQFTMWPMPQFNTAFWSLYFEMVMSLAMPFLCLALRRSNALAITLAAYAFVFVALPLTGLDVPANPLLLNGIRILQVMCHFLLGATLALYATPLGDLWRSLRRAQWLALAASLYAYWGLPGVPTGHALPTAWSLCAAAGSAGIVLCALHLAPLAKMLAQPLPEYLGRISYSVYLMHGIVLFAVLDLLHGTLAKVILLGIVLAASLALGHIFCLAVEEPAMRLGKRLARRMKEGDVQGAFKTLKSTSKSTSRHPNSHPEITLSP